MKKYKISAVSYTNTKPFIYGLHHSEIIHCIDLSLDIPSECAKKLLDNQVDIGLVPVATLLKMNTYNIISQYAIGATHAVDSVFILSNIPIEQIKTIQLDDHSMTSNLLAQVLIKHYLKLDIHFTSSPLLSDARVLIGDRTFQEKERYKYVYDLATLWHQYTGLSFVFAVWVSNHKEFDIDFTTAFDTALCYGINHIEEVVGEIGQREGIEVRDYLTRKLEFKLTEKHLQGMNKFLELAKDIEQKKPLNEFFSSGII